MSESDKHHNIPYRINSQYLPVRERTVEVHASIEEIEHFAQEGFFVRNRLFAGAQLEAMRSAIDDLEQEELRDSEGDGIQTMGNFGGLFIRHLMDKHPVYRDLLKYQPLLSVARAMLGPMVQIRGFSARIAYPELSNQGTQWHIHQQVVPDPIPHFFCYPHGIDTLIYLDDITDKTGPLCVLPGSHLQPHFSLPNGDFEDKPGQIELLVPAGTAVMVHSNLWHLAKGMLPGGHKRRLVIITYTPTWLRAAPYGVKPKDGFLRQLEESDDPEIRELLGVGGYT
jgi:ectoine hydroxylase-related dioxygenase (phytanoyl-CoA dioxygenase family)